MRFLFPGAKLGLENFMITLGFVDFLLQGAQRSAQPIWSAAAGAVFASRAKARGRRFVTAPLAGPWPIGRKRRLSRKSCSCSRADVKKAMTLDDCCPPSAHRSPSGQVSASRGPRRPRSGRLRGPVGLPDRTILRTERHRPLLWLPIIGKEPALRNKGYGHPGLSDRGPFPIRKMACRLLILIDTTDD